MKILIVTQYFWPEEFRVNDIVKHFSKKGYEIDVIREGAAQEEDDVELREFSDEIEAWVIEEFEKIGLDTARSVLNQDVADLVRRTDLEEETILDVMNILKEELEG